jgi:recombination protein RecA
MARKTITIAGPATPVARGTAKTELTRTIDAARKKYGEGVMVPGNSIPQPRRIPTGIFTLDAATLGGIPFNRCTMIYGAKHAGKSMTASRITGIVQKLYPDKSAVWEDIENTAEMVWMENLGVDTGNLLVAQPEMGEHASDLTISLIESLEVSLIVIDSVAALVPYKEYDSSAEDANVGLQARLIATMVRKIIPALLRERQRGHYVTIIFLNQYRSKIGGMAKFGAEPINIPGGKTLGHATSLEIDLKNYEVSGKAADGTGIIEHNEHSFTIKKNKMNNGERQGAFQVVRDDKHEFLREGEVDDVETIIAYAKNLGFYTGQGSATKVFDIPGFRKLNAKRDVDMIRILNEDPKVYWQARTALILKIAQNRGMPPYFLEWIDDQKDLELVRTYLHA